MYRTVPCLEKLEFALFQILCIMSSNIMQVLISTLVAMNY
jgi:hypothetical protein